MSAQGGLGSGRVMRRPLNPSTSRTPGPALPRRVLSARVAAGAESIKYRPVGAADAARSLDYLAQELRWLESISADLGRAL